eukprot:74099_1
MDTLIMKFALYNKTDKNEKVQYNNGQELVKGMVTMTKVNIDTIKANYRTKLTIKHFKETPFYIEHVKKHEPKPNKDAPRYLEFMARQSEIYEDIVTALNSAFDGGCLDTQSASKSTNDTSTNTSTNTHSSKQSEPKRRDVLETPIPDNSRSSRRSVRTSRTKSRTKSTDNAFVWELSAEEEDDDISSPRHKSSPPLSRKRRTCDDENTSPGRVQPPKKRHKSNGSLRSSRTHSHSISTPAQSITAQQERFDQHTYCHYDVDQHVREEILQLGSKKNVNGLVRSLNEILVANNNKLHELNEGLKAENRELRQQNINREKYESKAEEALNHLQREYEHVRGLLYYTRRRVKYVSQRREKEKKNDYYHSKQKKEDEPPSIIERIKRYSNSMTCSMNLRENRCKGRNCCRICMVYWLRNVMNLPSNLPRKQIVNSMH